MRTWQTSNTAKINSVALLMTLASVLQQRTARLEEFGYMFFT